MSTTLQRTSGLTEAQMLLGSGLRYESYDAMLATDLTRVVNAFALTLDTGSVWNTATVNIGRLCYPSTLCARFNQPAGLVSDFVRLRVRGLDMFGNHVEEVTPSVTIEAKTDNWVYLAKVFAVVLSVEYQDGAFTSIALSLGQRFDWVRTNDATNQHIAGVNLGIGLPMLLEYTPYTATDKSSYDRNNLIPARIAATGTLSFAAVAADTETVTIDGITYTMKTTIASAYDVLRGATASDSADNLRRAINLDGVPTGILTLSASPPSDGETVTIDGITYTFKTALTGTARQVLIGGSIANACTNLFAAINRSGTPGTQYTELTEKHPTVYADLATATTVVVKGPPDAATTETGANMAWRSSTLVVGSDIYWPGTERHPTVRASVATNVLTITALHAGNEGNLIPISDTLAASSWSTSTMQSGISDSGEVIGVVAREVSAVAAASMVFIPRSQFVIGQTADGWTGTIEKLGFQTSIGTYVTGDTLLVTVQMLSRMDGE
jgi:hypothetical protein